MFRCAGSGPRRKTDSHVDTRLWRGYDRVQMAWINDLEVQSVIQGDAPVGRLQVLSVQHSDFRRDGVVRRWWLRRNDLGGYNLLRVGDDAPLNRCTGTASPATAFMHPPPGKTLDDVVAELEKSEAK